MKHYSFKTGKTSGYFDSKEWKKHIINLERKTDALFHYINLTKPNYSTINWNENNLITDDQYMSFTSYPSPGAIYSYNNNDYYFIKCFNNNDLIWGKTNLYFINDTPNQDVINKIHNHDQEILIKPSENSWMLIDKNDPEGYKWLPSSSGYGGAYKINWIHTDNQYYIQCKLTNNGKDVVESFFNNPLETRWNSYINTNVVSKEIHIDNKDIKNNNNEFFQNNKQLMFTIFKEELNSFEPVYSDCRHENNTINNWQTISFEHENNINLGVYYW